MNETFRTILSSIACWTICIMLGFTVRGCMDERLLQPLRTQSAQALGYCQGVSAALDAAVNAASAHH